MPNLDHVRHPATPHVFPSLLHYFASVAPELPIDPIVLQSLLLCLLARNRHLLLRTRDEDVGIVQNLVTLALTHLLSYTTYKHKIFPSSTHSPSAFLTNLFFTATHQRTPQSRVRPTRSRTYPPGEPDASPLSPESASGNLSQTSPRPPLRVFSPHSDPVASTALPTPIRSPFHPSPDIELPRALVLSGLEYASAPCQRALLTVLQDKRVSLDGDPSTTWALPDDFILVYVCPLDPRERPKINHTLLDKFAMSATIGLVPSTRQAYASYLSSTLPSQHSLASAAAPTSPTDLTSRLLARLRALSTPAHTTLHPSLRTYISSLLTAARLYHELDGTLVTARAFQDVEALARAHRVLDGGDTGTGLIERAAAAWDQPANGNGRDPGGSESEFAPTAERAGDTDTHTFNGDGDGEGGGENGVNDRRQVRVQLPWDDRDTVASAPSKTAFSLSPSSLRDNEHEHEHAPEHNQDNDERVPAWLYDDHDLGKWDLSEGDVARIVPRVLSHRVRVREGPRNEVLSSVVFAAADGGGAIEGWKRTTVKEILVKILKEV